MSTSLRQLREIFSDDILTRKGNMFLLTSYAESLKAPLNDILEGVRKLVHRNSFDPKTSQRVFNIGMTEYSAYVLLPVIYSLIKREGSSINLKIKHLPLHADETLINNGEIDIAIAMLSQSTLLCYEFLFTDELVCAARSNHPLMQSNIELENYLAAEHLCFTIQDNTFPYITDVILANMGYPRKVIMRVPHVVPALYLLSGSDLIITLPERIICEAKKILPLSYKAPPFFLPTLSFVQIWDPQSTEDEGNRWLRYIIKKAAETIMVC